MLAEGSTSGTDVMNGYARSISPNRRRCILAAAAAASTLALGGIQESDAEKEERTEAVLAVLSSATCGRAVWLGHVAFQSAEDQQGNPLVRPRFRAMCGNSYNGLFNAERAKKHARDLFVAYGLRAVADHKLVGDGFEATVDVCDPSKQIGAKLSGLMTEKRARFVAADPEPDATKLDETEHSLLAKKGYHVQLAELNSYPLLDGDQVTPTLAYLLGLIAFLNQVTDGPDVDVTAIAGKERVRIALPMPEPTTALSIGKERELIVEAPMTVTLFIDPAGDVERAVLPQDSFAEPEWKPAGEKLSGSGILLLHLPIYPDMVMTVEQFIGVPLSVRTAGSTAVLPPHFNPDQPFRIVLELDPGEFHLPAHVLLLGVPE